MDYDKEQHGRELSSMATTSYIMCVTLLVGYACTFFVTHNSNFLGQFEIKDWYFLIGFLIFGALGFNFKRAANKL
jgi:hypothetical protein